MNKPADPRPRKRFGQHFLHDALIIDQIVAAINPQPGDRLIEIGPGTGALTLPLLQAAGELHAIELDRDLPGQLQRQAEGVGTLHIHQQDILHFPIDTLATGKQPLKIVGNLPYNISTPLLFHLFEYTKHIGEMVFMLQKEVVNRMAAVPGTKAWGKLSVMVQYHCDVEPLFVIGPQAFRPPPKVDSMLVRLLPHASPPVQIDDMSAFNDVVSAGFGMRRKTLRNALKNLLTPFDISRARIDSTVRAETLGLQQFSDLANILAASRQH